MLIIKNERLQLSDEFISCNGEIKPIGEEGKQWWVDTCEKHGYDYEFSPSQYSDDVLNRYNEIKNFDVKYLPYLEMYVSEGFISPEIGLLMENVSLKSAIDQLIMDSLGV